MAGDFSDSETEDNKKENAKKDIHIGRLAFRVGKIVSITQGRSFPNQYVEHVDYGGCEEGGLASSELVSHYKVADLLNRPVVALLNVVPQDQRGLASRLQLMCAKGEKKVELLSPPPETKPGDIVLVQGYPYEPDIPHVEDSRPVFEEILKDLSVNSDRVAVYKGQPLEVQGRGYITAETLKDCPITFE